jgi:adhesin transport system membrane fusion protein
MSVFTSAQDSWLESRHPLARIVPFLTIVAGPAGAWFQRRRRNRFAEFLPDTEGIVAAHHSPAAGLLILAIATMFGGLLTWVAITEIEQVVRAGGEVEPAGRVKTINHPNGGRVTELLVEEGARVEEGEALLRFDAEQASSEMDDLTARWQAKAAEADRLLAEAMGEMPAYDPLATEDRPDLIALQNSLLAARRDTRESRRRRFAQAIERWRHEANSLIADIGRLENQETMLGQRAGSVRTLAAQGLSPRVRLIAAEAELSDVGGNIEKTRAKLAAARAALAETESEQEGFEREWRSLVLAELVETEAERDRLAEARRRQAALLRQLTVHAPVGGIVQDLAIAGAGQSVGSNQPLMKLVPTASGLVIQAEVSNRDIGYLGIGQAAKVKVHALDYLRYGALAGEILKIDADSSQTREGGEHRYGITIRTKSDTLGDGTETRRVVPGMVVDVDFLVRERTILSYLTDRIFRLPDEVMHEG